MATELIFDTLKLATRLEREAGIDSRLASVLSMGLADELGERLATKTDLEREIRGVRTDLGAEIRALRSDLEAKTQSLRSDLGAEIQALRSDLETKTQSLRSDLGAEIQDLRAEVRVLGWMVKTTLAGVAALLAMAIPMLLKTLYGI
ncbi:MAG: CCDC90 family protein [Steroidobacteraceae bacterium]